jgi:hypothetical protein
MSFFGGGLQGTFLASFGQLEDHFEVFFLVSFFGIWGLPVKVFMS